MIQEEALSLEESREIISERTEDRSVAPPTAAYCRQFVDVVDRKLWIYSANREQVFPIPQ